MRGKIGLFRKSLVVLQCLMLDAQNLALSLVVHNQFHKNDKEDFVIFKVDKSKMEALYFNNFMRDFGVYMRRTTREYIFTPSEWQRIKDAFPDAIPSDEPDNFDNEAFDLMIVTIGYPVVRLVTSEFDFEQPVFMPDRIMDIRVPVGGEHGMVRDITYGTLYDLVSQQYPPPEELYLDTFRYNSITLHCESSGVS